MKKLYPLFLLCATFFSAALSFGQVQTLKFRSYTINEDLSQGTIFDISQDKHGFIWLGTADGLNRFDGYNFKVYKDSLVSPATRRMIPAGNEKIYLGTTQFQIAEFDQLHERYKLLITNPIERIGDSRLSFIDSGNNLWYTNDSSVYRYTINSGALTKKSFGGESIIYCNRFNREVYTISYRGKISVLDPVSLELKRTFQISPDKKFSIGGCYMDADSILWISGQAGDFYSLNPATSEIKAYRLPAPGIIVLCFVQKGNMLFMGTEKNGLLLFDVKKESFLPLSFSTKPSEQLLGGRVSALFLDNTDNLWVACDPYGVSVADLKEPKFKKINTGEGPGFVLRNNFVKSVFKDSTHFYVGYFRDGFDKIELSSGKVQSFKKNEKPGNLLDDVVHALEKDSYGNLWVGTENSLQKLSPNSNILENYSTPNNILRSDFIKALPNGDVMVSLIRNMGIFIRSGNKYNFQYIPAFDDTWVTHLDMGSSGNVWVSTQTGLYSLLLEKKDSIYSYKVKRELMQYGRVKNPATKKKRMRSGLLRWPDWLNITLNKILRGVTMKKTAWQTVLSMEYFLTDRGAYG